MVGLIIAGDIIYGTFCSYYLVLYVLSTGGSILNCLNKPWNCYIHSHSEHMPYSLIKKKFNDVIGPDLTNCFIYCTTWSFQIWIKGPMWRNRKDLVVYSRSDNWRSVMNNASIIFFFNQTIYRKSPVRLLSDWDLLSLSNCNK